jgi:hypothetical protein
MALNSHIGALRLMPFRGVQDLGGAKMLVVYYQTIARAIVAIHKQ